MQHPSLTMRAMHAGMACISGACASARPTSISPYRRSAWLTSTSTGLCARIMAHSTSTEASSASPPPPPPLNACTGSSCTPTTHTRQLATPAGQDSKGGGGRPACAAAMKAALDTTVQWLRR